MHCVRIEECGSGADESRLTKVVQAERTQGPQRSFEDRSNIMDSLHAIIANGLAERYTYLADGVRELAAPLSEEQFWQKTFPFGYSYGDLVLHMTGKFIQYIGAEFYVAAV